MTWRERIVAARERGGFTHEDHKRAYAWTTCAVGEQVDLTGERVQVLPVRFDGVQNEALVTLGVKFVGCVSMACTGHNWAPLTAEIDEAEAILDAVEDRVFELKQGAVAPKEAA